MTGGEFPAAILAALATTPVGSNVFPMVGPDQQDAPFVVYSGVGSAPENTLANGLPIENERIQIDVWSRSYAEARTLGATVRAAILAIPAPISVFLISEFESFDPNVKMFRRVQDYSFFLPR